MPHNITRDGLILHVVRLNGALDLWFLLDGVVRSHCHLQEADAEDSPEIEAARVGARGEHIPLPGLEMYVEEMRGQLRIQLSGGPGLVYNVSIDKTIDNSMTEEHATYHMMTAARNSTPIAPEESLDSLFIPEEPSQTSINPALHDGEVNRSQIISAPTNSGGCSDLLPEIAFCRARRAHSDPTPTQTRKRAAESALERHSFRHIYMEGLSNTTKTSTTGQMYEGQLHVDLIAHIAEWEYSENTGKTYVRQIRLPSNRDHIVDHTPRKHLRSKETSWTNYIQMGSRDADGGFCLRYHQHTSRVWGAQDSSDRDRTILTESGRFGVVLDALHQCVGFKWAKERGHKQRKPRQQQFQGPFTIRHRMSLPSAG
ncbi:hypothetical protein EJ04DRAFT_300 [Polyplosphaeria fusca]|uniref:Uncharacterized protein n=1 Tax=Polyplosphaeria fusca TaxID=682080 RepID=A0A9P4RBV7_9PLEO|nr:hypothetical protein EJ04DRAFT_300 [Polyplosphaeria fusca]